MVQTIDKSNKMAAILSLIENTNTIEKQNRPIPFEFRKRVPIPSVNRQHYSDDVISCHTCQCFKLFCIFFSVPMVLVGNKTDLHMERRVSTEDGKALADEMKAVFLETSAKENRVG